MRFDRLFTHRLWMTPLASYAGLAAIVYGFWKIDDLSQWWLLALAIGTFLILMGVTVGMHRLFCHMSFRTSRVWHVVLGWLGTMAIYGSTVQWPAMHASHHKFADTDKDPHYTGWRYLFWKKNNPTTFHRRTLTRLYRDPMHRFLHRYYALVVVASMGVMYAISPWLLLYGYLMPLGWLHLVGSFHQVFAHGKDGAKDQRWLEWVLFTGGEWLHKHHHDRPRDIRFGASDAGYWFIRLISRRRA